VLDDAEILKPGGHSLDTDFGLGTVSTSRR
jgi:hypothetical protein